jgi:hypothetical protein
MSHSKRWWITTIIVVLLLIAIDCWISSHRAGTGLGYRVADKLLSWCKPFPNE